MQARTPKPAAAGRTKAEAKPINTYGLQPQSGWSQLEYDMLAFALRWPIEKGALTRYQHFRNVCEGMFGDKIEWNPWLEKQIKSLCDNKWVGWAGCASSGKTYGVALFCVVWWLCMPDESSVILTSTTKGMIRKRAWPVIQKLYTSLPASRIGNMVDSKTTWQASKGDDKHAIFAIAVAEGSTAKAVANIQGIHTKRQLVIIDEATDTPEAAFEACANLFSGPEEFQLVVIGNPASHFDPMGRFCEPLRGWLSVTVEDGEWETIRQLDGEPGVVIRFDAEDSPNVKAGKVLYPYLVTEAQTRGARSKYGEQSPLFWKFHRGFWPPDGLKRTIFNEALIAQMHGTEKFTFIGRKLFTVAGLDPAFGGGDRPVLTFATCGDLAGDKMGIQLGEQIQLSIDAGSTVPVHFQLADQTIEHCRKRGVTPDYFGILSSGEGGGLADIIARKWGNHIIRIEEGGRPSDMPVSKEDARLCSEVYERKNVELWYTARSLLESGQLRGINASMALEFCNREFNTDHRKIRLQTKDEMKTTFARSPDLADSAAAAIEAARWRGVNVAAIGETVRGDARLAEVFEKAAAVYEGADYAPEEPAESDQFYTEEMAA